MEESFRGRLNEKELSELDALLATQPPQYERKVGMVMAARFFQPGDTTEDTMPNMDRLNVAWASESGIVGVWDLRAAKQLFKQTLHKETSQCASELRQQLARLLHVAHLSLVFSIFSVLSFDLNWSGRYGVSCSSGSDILAWSIDTVAGRIDELARINVPHDGLAEVVLREDGRLFATAGWDHRSVTHA